MLQFFRGSIQQDQTSISVLTLMAFLFALFVHAKHSTQQILVLEKQDCYVCQQNIDTPPKVTIVLPMNTAMVELAIRYVTANVITFTSYQIPQLRAPPISQ